MSWARTVATARLELRQTLRRPLLYVLLAVLVLTSWGLSSGGLTVSSGDSSVGGDKSWINSETSIALSAILIGFLLYTFFVTVVAGMSILRDDELGTGEILHSTPLRPAEYVWGKFAGLLGAFLIAILVHQVATIFFFQFLPISNAEEIRGPFVLANYLRPTLLFTLPMVLFFAGTAFAVGERTRRPILVFFLPVALFLACIFFLWSWTPTWLDPRWNRLLMLIDPSGFRWFQETWTNVDRGVALYNTQAVAVDGVLLSNRLWVALVGLLSVALTVPHCARKIAGEQGASRWAAQRQRLAAADLEAASAQPAAEIPTEPLRSLGMRSGRPGLWRGIQLVLRAEARELLHQPGLYLFVPLILFQVYGVSTFALGPFGTEQLVTSGFIAVNSMNTLTLLVCFLLLFFTVESLERERSSGTAQLLYATPISTASILFGKVTANAILAGVILLGALAGAVIALLAQGRTPIELWPFMATWGALLAPTFFFWGAFVTLLLALFRDRYSVYAMGLAALAATGYAQLRGEMSWVWNWTLWSAVSWSDLGTFPLNRQQLLLNRLMVLSAGVLAIALAVRLFRRRELDASRIVHRLHPRALLFGTLRAMPFAVVPIVLGAALAFQVRQGFQSEATEKIQKDYWRKNLATWKDAPLPTVDRIDIDLELEPTQRSFAVTGSYMLRNIEEEPLRTIPMTASPQWEELTWSLGGETVEPEDRLGLYLLRPEQPLEPGATLELGFQHRGVLPRGATKNGGGAGLFVLPVGVVLHMFTPNFLPLVGYLEQIGVDEDNQYEPKQFEEGFWEETLRPAFGMATPFLTRVRIRIPEAYTANSVGTLVEESVEDGYRTVVWESDYPVKMVNVVAGKWEVRRAGGTAVFHHPEHTYNIDEISEALQASRRYYSEWFHPFPWAELKLSQFANLAGYAQGFPTNITFSEGIGFLTKSDPKTNAAFLVTAHEAAHQWWGNLITPGNGPGGNILSEGMSHYSTLLLQEQVLGERHRIEFAKRLEERYGEQRQVDSERALVWTDGSRAGDTTVTYDKGGWVMWMLHDLMGRDNALAGLQEMFARYLEGPDHPVLQDLIATLRPFAPDADAFDEFVEQWYFDVVVPEYRLTDAKLEERPGGGHQVTVTVENTGTGRMPVEVSIERGVRFPEEDSEEDGTTNEPNEEDEDESKIFHQARTRIVLGAGEKETVVLSADFEPERVLVDPDAKVLQLRRQAAIVRF